MSQWSANINVMMNAARRAGRSLMRDFNEVDKLQVSEKGPGDFVTRADQRAEEILVAYLQEARPNYGYLGEEGTDIKGEDPTRRWIVDPLDGTKNFIHAQPHWAVSIALEHKKQIVAAVILCPVTDEIFVAERGGGAWMNDKRIRVSGRRNMAEMMFSTGIPTIARPGLPQTMRQIARLAPICAGLRSCGASALDLAYIAAGRSDGYWDQGVQPWDIAAGILLVREAGGLVEGANPDDDPMETGALIAAPNTHFDQFAKLLRED